jgi:hypothetical protein
MSEPCEIAFTEGGVTNEVVRVGETVRRTMGPHSPFVHQLLRLLEKRGFAGAPRLLGVTADYELLSFIAGTVPHEPVAWTDQQLQAVMALLREFHDASAGSALAGICEVVCHGDIAPWNLVLAGGVPFAFIDYDDAAPGLRADDLAYAAWCFLDLGDAGPPLEWQLQRLRLMCASYGYCDGGAQLVNALARRQQRTLTFRTLRAQAAFGSDQHRLAAARVRRVRTHIRWRELHRSALEQTAD